MTVPTISEILDPIKNDIDSLVVEHADSFTLALTDNKRCLKCTKDSAMTITVPPASSVAFPTGAAIEICQYGMGQVTIANGSGVIIRAKGSKYRTNGRYSGCALKRLAVDEWWLIGDLI
jgi:hypothetical protein